MNKAAMSGRRPDRPYQVGDGVQDLRLTSALAYLIPLALPLFLLLDRRTALFARRHAANAFNGQLTLALAIATAFGLSTLVDSPPNEGREIFNDFARVVVGVHVLVALALAVVAGRGQLADSPLAFRLVGRRSSRLRQPPLRWAKVVRIVLLASLIVTLIPHLWVLFKDGYAPGISGANTTDESGTLILDPRAYGVELTDPVFPCPSPDCWPEDSLAREMESLRDRYGPTEPATGSRMLVVRLPYPNQIRRDGVVVVKRVEVIPEAADQTLCRWIAVAFEPGDSVEMQEGEAEVALVEDGMVRPGAHSSTPVPCTVPPTEA